MIIPEKDTGSGTDLCSKISLWEHEQRKNQRKEKLAEYSKAERKGNFQLEKDNVRCHRGMENRTTEKRLLSFLKRLYTSKDS